MMPEQSDALDLVVKELEARGLVPEDALAVFAGGSYARGWNNADSDVDLYVVSDESSPGVATTPPLVPLPPNIPMEWASAGGIDCDIEYWTADQVWTSIARFEAHAGRIPDSATVEHLSLEEIYLLERLHQPLIARGGEWLESTAARLKASEYHRVILGWCFDHADNCCEDALGQLASDDAEAATISARSAFGFTIDGLLASYGEYGRAPKWRPRRFRAVDPREIMFDTYWAVEVMVEYDPTNPRLWIESTVGKCRQIMSEVVM